MPVISQKNGNQESIFVYNIHGGTVSQAGDCYFGTHSQESSELAVLQKKLRGLDREVTMETATHKAGEQARVDMVTKESREEVEKVMVVEPMVMAETRPILLQVLQES